MTRLRLPVFLILSLFTAFIIQGCNKDTITATAYTTDAFQANIDGAVWAPDTLNTVITFDPTALTKTLTCVGTKAQKQIIFSVTLPNAASTPGFPIGTYSIDGNLVTAQYNTQQLSNGNYVFLPAGTVEPGSGAVVITAVDSVKKTLTGTFHFYSRTTTYDNNGNVISTSVHNITAGEFTATPYVFSNNQ